jgi:hypothetical protein
MQYSNATRCISLFCPTICSTVLAVVFALTRTETARTGPSAVHST